MLVQEKPEDKQAIFKNILTVRWLRINMGFAKILNCSEVYFFSALCLTTILFLCDKELLNLFCKTFRH